jgi:hypothetical protein
LYYPHVNGLFLEENKKYIPAEVDALQKEIAILTERIYGTPDYDPDVPN